MRVDKAHLVLEPSQNTGDHVLDVSGGSSESSSLLLVRMPHLSADLVRLRKPQIHLNVIESFLQLSSRSFYGHRTPFDLYFYTLGDCDVANELQVLHLKYTFNNFCGSVRISHFSKIICKVSNLRMNGKFNNTAAPKSFQSRPQLESFFYAKRIESP